MELEGSSPNAVWSWKLKTTDLMQPLYYSQRGLRCRGDKWPAQSHIILQGAEKPLQTRSLVHCFLWWQLRWLPWTWGCNSLWWPQASPDAFREALCWSPIWKSPSLYYSTYSPSEHQGLAISSRGSCWREWKKPAPTAPQSSGCPTSSLCFPGLLSPSSFPKPF